MLLPSLALKVMDFEGFLIKEVTGQGDPKAKQEVQAKLQLEGQSSAGKCEAGWIWDASAKQMGMLYKSSIGYNVAS